MVKTKKIGSYLGEAGGTNRSLFRAGEGQTLSLEPRKGTEDLLPLRGREGFVTLRAGRVRKQQIDRLSLFFPILSALKDRGGAGHETEDSIDSSVIQKKT